MDYLICGFLLPFSLFWRWRVGVGLLEYCWFGLFGWISWVGLGSRSAKGVR